MAGRELSANFSEHQLCVFGTKRYPRPNELEAPFIHRHSRPTPSASATRLM